MVHAVSFLSEVAGAVRIRVHAQPNAPKNQIVGIHGDALKIKIHAPPEDGRANAELCEYLAKLAGVAKSRVTLVSGHSSRAKVVEIEGVSLDDLKAVLHF